MERVFDTPRGCLTRVRASLETNLHDEEEEEDDEDADLRMEPDGRATQAGRRRRPGDFGPGEVVKQGVDALAGHQLPQTNEKKSLALAQDKGFTGWCHILLTVQPLKDKLSHAILFYSVLFYKL